MSGELMNSLDSLLSKEEMFWRQRSRTQWLKEGDRNTKFFHQWATNRRRKNTIKGLWDANEIWQESPRGIERKVMEYFREIFWFQGILQNAMGELLDMVALKITMEMNAELLRPYMEEEIKTTLFQMHPSKSLGPDGMSSLFYHKFWHIVGTNVVEAVR